MATIYVDKPARDGLNPPMPTDSYITGPELAMAVMKWLHESVGLAHVKRALDPGAGTGVWGKAIRESFPSVDRKYLMVDGVELLNNRKPNAYNFWYPRTDFVDWKPPAFYDLIAGNPPFKHAEAFVRNSLSILKYQGVLCFLLPSDFAHTAGRSRGLFKEFVPDYLVSLAERLQFTGPNGEDLGKANPNNYVLFVWRKLAEENKHCLWESLSWKTKKPNQSSKSRTILRKR